MDEDPRPGRFLITGSVDLFKGSISPGILLHDGERIQRTAQGLFAMPVKALWEA